MIREYYQAGERKMELEFYLPEEKRESCPCVVFFYGGGFTSRNMDSFSRHCEYFSSRGFICVNADYGLVNETGDLKECYRDGFRAYEEVLKLADKYGIDRQKTVVCGSSSGGSLAAHVALITGKPVKTVLINPGVAWLYGNVEYIEREGSGTGRIIEQEAHRHQDWEQAYYLLEEHRLPDTLIMVGTADEVCYRGSALFHQKALEKGYESKLVLFEGLKHGQFNWQRSEGNTGFSKSLEIMDEFLKNMISTER